jgi:amino acid transporter
MSAISLSFLAAHWLPLAAAFAYWARRPISQSGWTNRVANVVGAIGILVAIYCYLWFTTDEGGPDQELAKWFLVLSVLTWGLLPAVTVTLHALVGRLLGRLIRKWIDRRH